MPAKTLQERQVDADVRCRHWLALATDANEAGDRAKAERCEDKARFWNDRWNHLCGRGERPAPKE